MIRKILITVSILTVAVLPVYCNVHGAVNLDGEEVVFSYEAPPGNNVYLVGDFNGWNPTIDRMIREDGRYRVRLFLLPNKYSYRFVVNGERVVDKENPARDPEGNSVFYFAEENGQYRLYFSRQKPENDGEMYPDIGFGLEGLFTGGRDSESLAFTGWMEAEVTENLLYRVNAAFSEDDEPFLLGSEAVSGNEDWRIRGFYRTEGIRFKDPLEIVGPAGPYGYQPGLFSRGIGIEKSREGMFSGRIFIADRLEGYRSGMEYAEAESDETGAIRITERDPVDDDITAMKLGLKVGGAELRYLYRRNMARSGWISGTDENYKSAEKVRINGVWGKYSITDNSSMEVEYLKGDAVLFEHDSLDASQPDISQEIKSQSGWKLYAGVTASLFGSELTGAVHREKLSNYSTEGLITEEGFKDVISLKLESERLGRKFTVECSGEFYGDFRAADFMLRRRNFWLDCDRIRPAYIPLLNSNGIYVLRSVYFSSDSSSLFYYQPPALSLLFTCDAEDFSKRVLELRGFRSISLSPFLPWFIFSKTGRIDLVTDIRAVYYHHPEMVEEFFDIYTALRKDIGERGWIMAGVGFSPYRVDRWKYRLSPWGRELYIQEKNTFRGGTAQDLEWMLQRLKDVEDEMSLDFRLSVEAGIRF